MKASNDVIIKKLVCIIKELEVIKDKAILIESHTADIKLSNNQIKSGIDVLNQQGVRIVGATEGTHTDTTSLVGISGTIATNTERTNTNAAATKLAVDQAKESITNAVNTVKEDTETIEEQLITAGTADNPTIRDVLRAVKTNTQNTKDSVDTAKDILKLSIDAVKTDTALIHQDTQAIEDQLSTTNATDPTVKDVLKTTKDNTLNTKNAVDLVKTDTAEIKRELATLGDVSQPSTLTVKFHIANSSHKLTDIATDADEIRLSNGRIDNQLSSEGTAENPTAKRLLGDIKTNADNTRIAVNAVKGDTNVIKTELNTVGDASNPNTRYRIDLIDANTKAVRDQLTTEPSPPGNPTVRQYIKAIENNTDAIRGDTLAIKTNTNQLITGTDTANPTLRDDIKKIKDNLFILNRSLPAERATDTLRDTLERIFLQIDGMIKISALKLQHQKLIVTTDASETFVSQLPISSFTFTVLQGTCTMELSAVSGITQPVVTFPIIGTDETIRGTSFENTGGLLIRHTLVVAPNSKVYITFMS